MPRSEALTVYVWQVITVQEGESFISLFPADTLKISCSVDKMEEAPIIGRQWFSWVPRDDEHYRWVIAPARTFYTSLKVPLLNHFVATLLSARFS